MTENRSSRWNPRLAGACLALALLLPAVAQARMNLFACEPEWGALAKEIGGPAVEVFTATTAHQDPHHIQARPSLIAHMRRADMLVCTGADLEIGWLPLLLRKAHNAKVQRGKPGHFLAARQVRLLERPANLDRAEGDIHPLGNPHIQTDPRNLTRVAQALAQRLATLDPKEAAGYRQRLQRFLKRWRESIARWKRKAAPLEGTTVVVHHRQWPYLMAWLGMKQVGELEPKPGVPPTAGHLAELKARLQESPARLIVHAAYMDPAPSHWLSKQTGIPEVTLPFTVGGTPRARDLFSLFDDTIDRLLGALR